MAMEGAPDARSGGTAAVLPQEGSEAASRDRADAVGPTIRQKPAGCARTGAPAWLAPSRPPAGAEAPKARTVVGAVNRPARPAGGREAAARGLVPFTTKGPEGVRTGLDSGPVRASAQVPPVAAQRLDAVAKFAGVGGVPYHGGYLMRGRWLTEGYTGLRNAAWAVRNARVANDLNPLALKLVLSQAQALIAKGEPLADVLEAFAELLLRP